jgi:hypothetical protein
MTTEISPAGRTRFFDGERLTAADLLAAQAYEAELRWLHNRCLHPWGVALGLAVAGAAGDRAVSVSAGYALDCRGRDLLVPEPLSLQAPPVAGDGAGGPARFLLTVSYLEDKALPASTRAGVCGTSGAVRLPEHALVRFQSQQDLHADTRFRPGIDVVLAAVAVKGCALAGAPSTDERQEVALAEPYIRAGRTPDGGTPWQLWPDSSSPSGVMTTVDTSAAAFGDTPLYQAEVAGDRIFSKSGGGQATVQGFTEVANAGAESFDVRVVLPSSGGSGALNPPEVFAESFMDRLSNELSWSVMWIGVEA